MKRISSIIYISGYSKKCISKKNNGIKNSALIYNPIDDIFFENRNKNKINKNLYFVGEVKKRKGLHDLLFAIGDLKQDGLSLMLHVIGGFKEKKYKNMIIDFVENSNLNGNVIFHGWQNKKEMVEIVKDFSTFILPSHQETLPLSVAEAMAMGKIVIATDLPGVKEMIEDGVHGYLYQKGDIEALKRLLLKVYTDNIDTKSIRENAFKKSFNSFSSQKICSQTIDFYKKIKDRN